MRSVECRNSLLLRTKEIHVIFTSNSNYSSHFFISLMAGTKLPAPKVTPLRKSGQVLVEKYLPFYLFIYPTTWDGLGGLT